jgi:D,D-heptose 1,7-bisphosphate phosphatase
MGRVKQAVFLVGGKGTRLGPLTATTPKPLLEIAPGLRFLDVVIEQAARYGMTDIILLAGHLGDQVEAAYQGRTVRGATIQVLREPEPAGTGGALLLAADRLDPWFLMCNGDSLFGFNLRALTKDLSHEFLGRLALRTVPDVSRYGTVSMEGDRVTGFHEKQAGRSGPGMISGGVYLLSREIASGLRSPSSIEQDVFPGLAAAGALRGALFDGYFLDMGLPDTYEQAMREIPQRRVRPAAFLDRDGVLNAEIGYAHRPEDLEWVDGAREAVLHLNELGYYVFVVTNQAGIARGYYGEAEMRAFHERMQDELAEIGAHVDAFYHCPFHEEAAVECYRVGDHPDRKPNPGMILRGLREWPVQREGSFLIGDRESDIEAARRAGIPGFLFTEQSLRATVDDAISRLGAVSAGA